MDSELKFRQEAGERVEARMMAFLSQFSPVDDVKMGDVKSIAMYARTIAFDEFSPIKTAQ